MSEELLELIKTRIGYAMASVVSGNNQPDMSGDPRNRLSPLRRRHFDEAVEYAAEGAIEAYRKHQADAGIVEVYADALAALGAAASKVDTSTTS